MADKRNPLAGLGGKSETPPDRYTDTLGTGRKRRKDASGRRKKDYHKSTQTLAVRLPDELAQQVRQQAEAEGLSVNAWLQQLIKRQLE